MSPGEQGERAALFSVRELVTDAPNSQHQLRVLRVIFDLCSQAIDVRINCPIVPFIRIIPNLLEQILAREDSSRVRGEIYASFSKRGRNWLGADPPITLFVLEDIGVLLTIESTSLLSSPAFAAQATGKMWWMSISSLK